MILTCNGQIVNTDLVWVKYIYGQRPESLTTWSGALSSYCQTTVTTSSGLNQDATYKFISDDGPLYNLQYLSNEGDKYYFVGYKV